MNSRVSHFLTVAAMLFISALVILAIPSFSDPEFEVINNSTEAVSVVAAWGSYEKTIGRIAPKASHEFSVNDEAAIRFRVRYSSGREIESESLYFTNGTKVIATISGYGVEVRYDYET